MANEFHEYNPGWSLDQWREMASEGFFRRMDSLNELPQGGKLPDTLTGKLNAVTVAASACKDSYTFVMQTYRVDEKDKKGWAIDQQTLVASIDKNTGSYYGGFVMHGDWPNYTTYPPKLKEDLSASGFTANITFLGKPAQVSGAIEDLVREGILDSFTAPMDIVNKEKQSDGKGEL